MVPRGISRASELMRGLCCGALDVVLFEGVGIARQVIAIVQHLVAQGESQQDDAAPRQHDFNRRSGPRSSSGWVASSVLPMPASSANTRKFATMAVFPELRNGETTPESGSAPSTPA